VSWNLIQKFGGLKVPEIIDKELEKVRKQGQTPKKIYVGAGLYDEIRYEQFEPFAADEWTGSLRLPYRGTDRL
jgi:hypothetical protein